MWIEKNFALIIKFLTGECSKREEKKILSMMEKDAQVKATITFMQKMWNVKPESISEDKIHEAWNLVKTRLDLQQESTVTQRKLQVKKPSFLFRPVFQYAVLGMILLISVSVMVSIKYDLSWKWLTSESSIEQYQTFSVANGDRAEIHLSDGTHVILDAGSTLKYPQKFSNERHVYLKGEAFFEVAHNKEKPFLIDALYAEIKVVGTRFNVRAWNEKPEVEVTVSDGIVLLHHVDMKESEGILLTENKQGKVFKEGTVSAPIFVNPDDYTTWMNDKIKFVAAPLKEVFAQIERWSDLKIIVKDQRLENLKVTVALKKNSVDESLTLISTITNTKVTRDGNTVWFE